MTTEQTVPCWLLRSKSDPCDILGPFASEQELHEFVRDNSAEVPADYEITAEELAPEDYERGRKHFFDGCVELGYIPR